MSADLVAVVFDNGVRQQILAHLLDERFGFVGIGLRQIYLDPWRTSPTPEMPSPLIAPSIALPCGSRTPFFSVILIFAFIGSQGLEKSEGIRNDRFLIPIPQYLNQNVSWACHSQARPDRSTSRSKRRVRDRRRGDGAFRSTRQGGARPPDKPRARRRGRGGSGPSLSPD